MLGLFARSTLFAFASALGAVVIALPVAIALGRSQSMPARLLWMVVPLPLLLPTMVLGYGWQHVLALVGVNPRTQSLADVARCVGILAAWLWPIAAMVIGFSLRRIDQSLLEHAAMDGVLGRTLARRAIAPALLSLSICTVLAMQEFSIFESPGISVIATEVRMIFETGTLSSSTNPIAALTGGVGVAGSADLPARAAMAFAAGIPTLMLTAILGFAAIALWQRTRLDEAIELAQPPSGLGSRPGWTIAGWLVVIATIALPIGAMVMSLDRPFNPVRVTHEHLPQVLASLWIAGATGIVGIIIAVCSAMYRPRWMITLAIANFLIGGQFSAIALLRVLSGSDVGVWILDSNLAVVVAHVGRFAWIALLAGASLHAGPWRAYREMAGVDGASALQLFFRVILGIGWPVLALAALLMAALSLSEVPATALLVPPSLVPMLLTWVHKQNYSPMLEASLMLCTIVLAMGWSATLLFKLSRSRLTGVSRRVSHGGSQWLPALVLSVIIGGCGKVDQPEAVWCRAGRDPGEVIYPRAIARAPDGTFYVIDRVARIQHLDTNGKFLNGWQMTEWAQGKPVGLTVDGDGNLWTADTHYHRVIVFTPDGREIKRFGTHGSGPGEFDLPTDIAFDRLGNIYVSEYGDNNRIQVFDPSLKFVRSFGQLGAADGDLSRPQSIVIIDDLLYTSDSCNHRISVFKLDGTFVKNLGRTGSAPGEYRFPYGLDADESGNLLVAEFGNNRIQKIDRHTGAGLWKWGTPGRLPGELNYPWAIAADGNRAIVVDAGNNRLQVVRF
ncbi:MAG: hypothetical protein H7144_07410 [Burkholderiales bacterium]|nr:hypothetical protein [Phycisphaerae bacterium]